MTGITNRSVLLFGEFIAATENTIPGKFILNISKGKFEYRKLADTVNGGFVQEGGKDKDFKTEADIKNCILIIIYRQLIFL